jgi:MoxR-like ATPase
LYSRFGGIYFLSIPVQPDWDSPQSLFGFFNSIEKRFNAPSLLRALVSFQANKSKSSSKDKIYDLSDNVLIVLLDEMNMAHIELYFAELLSKLEERRGENKDITFEVDLGAGNDKYKVVLTDNVKWVGTMNEDEKTKSLSDKVVDRGNIISFPRPEGFVRYNNTSLKPEYNKIKRSVWENWVNDKYSLDDKEAKYYMEIVVSINNALKEVNRALGHRVWQSIENYIISHSLVKEYKDDENRRKKALNYAFEEALVHKVMPKLRGMDTDGNQRENCLDKIESILSSNELKTILPDIQKAMESVTGTFICDSAKYLTEDYNMEG